jgi:hypothetical protein
VVAAGVAGEHDGGGARHRSLDVPAQELLRLALVVGALERLDELLLLAAQRHVAPPGALHEKQAAAEQERAQGDDEPMAVQRSRSRSDAASRPTIVLSRVFASRKSSISALRSRAPLTVSEWAPR